MSSTPRNVNYQLPEYDADGHQPIRRSDIVPKHESGVRQISHDDITIPFFRMAGPKTEVIPAKSSSTPETIIVLDDEENQLRAHKRALIRQTRKIILSHFPDLAIYHISDAPNGSLIISDNQMLSSQGEEFLGVELAKFTHQERKRKGIGFILTSGSVVEETTELIREGIISTFINKLELHLPSNSYGQTNLSQAIRNHFNQRFIK